MQGPRLWLLPLVLLAGIISAAPCSESNVGHSYTTCVNNQRNALFYWIDPCEESGFHLPPTKYSLPCNHECNPGYYLPFGERECSPCNPGEYSVGGGDMINEWNAFPPRMTVDCTGEGCQNWQLAGNYIHSGANSDVPNSSMNLRFFANFIRPSGNKIQFRYMVDAEDCWECDGLIFYIDDVAMTELLSNQPSWETLEFEVTPGYHEFTWSFVKDHHTSWGADQASLKWIHLIGTTFAADSCTKCPHGTYSDKIAAPNCTLCDYNHFNPDTGKTSCQACSPSTFAFLGATDCTELPPCESRHKYSTRTPCVTPGLTQNIVSHFQTLDNGMVKVCDENNPLSIPLPAPILNVPCYCPPGQQLKPNGDCEYCPEGQFRMNETSCKPCPAGSAALKAMYFADWSHIPSGISTRCMGICDTLGWVARGEHIDTGYGGFRGDQTFLTISNVELVTPGTLEYTYFLAPSCVLNCPLHILVKNEGTKEIESTLMKTGTKTFSKSLLPGNYSITWRFTVLNPVYAEVTKVKIFTISISGMGVGGAPACVPCPPGTEAVHFGTTTCKPCERGYYSTGSGSGCKLADAGYFVKDVGAPTQTPCGLGTTSNAARTDCVTDCTFTQTVGNKKYQYNLKPLDKPEMHYAGSDGDQYFLNLCSRNQQNSSCWNDGFGPLHTFGCSNSPSVPNSPSLDIGSTIGFKAMDDPTQGLVVYLTQGSLGCAATYSGVKIPRSTNISMICDLSAGVGSPVPNNLFSNPRSTCAYSFVWRSVYGCPVCTPDDYDVSFTECINGMKVKTWVRKSACWDPNPTPPVALACHSCPKDKHGNICSNNGVCDEATGLCGCDLHWAGSTCSSCSVGFFSPDCSKVCPGGRTLPCNGHGVCDSGAQGTGVCRCSTGWTGASCSKCDDGYEGEDCSALPVSVSDVVPWWGFLILFGGIFIIIAVALILWRQKRVVEHKYTSLLRNQPIELGDDGKDNQVHLDDDEIDEDENDVADRNW